MGKSRTTFSLIGDRYLDTQFQPEDIALVERELQARGIVGPKRWLVEHIAAGGLWWNIVWWEWINLNGRDICIGWLYNLIIGSALFSFVGHYVGWHAAFASIMLAHFITLYVGFSLRSGTVSDHKEA